MSVAIYLKDKKKKIESKYHQVTKQFESSYGVIHQKVTSKFHREPLERTLVRMKIDKLIKKSTVSIESKIIPKKTKVFFSRCSTQRLENTYQQSRDWTWGRVSVQTIQVFVREGQIVEKVFLTPKGNIISVKRAELGLLLRLSL